MSDGDRIRPKAAWARFSLMDCAILVLAAALAAALIGIPARNLPPEQRRESAAPSVSWLLGEAVLSGIIAGPLILAGHWLRGRRAPLSAGERFWLAPTVLLVLWVPTFLAGPVTRHSFYDAVAVAISTLVWVIAQGACSIAAFISLVVVLLKGQTPVECRWTDYSGRLACAIIALLIAYFAWLIWFFAR